MNIAQIKVWLILLLSTFILLIGIVFSIFLSSLYLSPLGQNYAKKELNKVNKIVENDYSILKEVFKDFTISNEEKIVIDNLNIVKNNWDGLIGVYAHSGDDIQMEWTFDQVISPEDYLNYCEKWLKKGINIIGGCCGTGPEHIRYLRDNLILNN